MDSAAHEDLGLPREALPKHRDETVVDVTASSASVTGADGVSAGRLHRDELAVVADGARRAGLTTSGYSRRRRWR